MSRALVFAAGLAGAAGVALSAVAAHRGGANLATAAAMLLAHAPALLAIGGLTGAAASSRLTSLAAVALAAGLILFCGDLAAREFLGDRLFPMAAPAGGILLIAGWLGIAISGIIRR